MEEDYTTESDFNETFNENDVEYIFRYGITATALLSTAYTIVFVLGVLGNIAVVLVVFKNVRMRSPTNQFIANLAIADLLVIFLCLPFTLIGNLFPAWILGIFLCKTVSYFQGVSVSASINTLMAISIERCCAISFPLSGSMSPNTHKTVLFFIWTIALTVNLPWLFVFTLRPLNKDDELEQGEMCVELWPSKEYENLYFSIANLTICFLGPLIVISICYLIIWKKVANRSQLGERINNHRDILLHRSKVKVIKMLLVVIITFALSWLPLYTMFFIIKFNEEILEQENAKLAIYFAIPIVQWLGAANSCINPIVYAFMNVKFRLGFKKLVERIWCVGSTVSWGPDSNEMTLKQYKGNSFYN